MSQKLRIIIPLALLGAAGVAYAAHVSAGTLSAFGWESISLICPIGALGTMLASKMLVPRAVISWLWPPSCFWAAPSAGGSAPCPCGASCAASSRRGMGRPRPPPAPRSAP